MVTLLVVATLCAPVATREASAGPPRWAPADRASIRPGVQTHTDSLQCTASFVLYDARSVYLAQAAHCTSYVLDANDGCSQRGHKLGTQVQVQGASRPATLVYSSFLTMQRLRETRPAVCEGNDFALLRLHPADVSKVNPSVPFWGGPTTAQPGRTSVGERAYSFGNSWVRGGVEALMPKTGVNTSPVHNGIEETMGWGAGASEWTHYVTTASPGIFGDSGSPFLDAAGRALGVLSTVSLDGSTGVADLTRALQYMKATTTLDAVTLAAGTEPFTAPRQGPDRRADGLQPARVLGDAAGTAFVAGPDSLATRKSFGCATAEI